MTDTLSILEHQSLPVVKTWRADGTIEDYAKPKHFKLTQITVDGAHGLSALLTDLEKNPYACIIRGTFIGDNPHRVLRRKEVFDDQPLHTILIEIDKVPCDTAALLDDPVSVIDAFILEALPKAFHGVTYHFQLSNSCGHPSKAGLLKVHLWFCLKTPYTSAQLKAWAHNNDLGDVLDVSVFDSVQVHYTGAPLFQPGAINPVKTRSGLVEGLVRDEVDLILDPLSLSAEARRPAKASDYTGHDPMALWLEENGIAKGTGENGKVFLDCPFAEFHTDGKIGETDTTYLPPRPGFPDGIFHCSHASCAKRESSEFESALGCADLYFEPIPVVDDFLDSLDKAGQMPEKSVSVRFPLIDFADFANRPPPEYIIDGILPRADLGVMYGASTAGKTFEALDMAFSIVRGVEWNGHPCKQGRVVYIASEGAGGCQSRVKAYMQHNQLTGPLPFQIIADAPNFLLVEDVADIAKSILTLGKADLIIVDTLSQVTPGANENSGEDMGKVLKHCRALRKATGATIMLIHHAGKDESKGARGWSGLKAACDFEFEISRKGDERFLKVTKQKDGEDGQVFAFKLVPVVLNKDVNGSPVSSCYVEWLGEVQKKDKPLPPAQQHGLRILAETIENGAQPPKEVLSEAGSEFVIQAGKVATIQSFQERYVQSRGDIKKDSAQRTFRSVKSGLLLAGKIKITGNWVWIPEKPADLSKGIDAP